MNKYILSFIFCTGLAACANYVGPDEHGRICDPDSIMPGNEGCDIPGCTTEDTALRCVADGRVWDCRLNPGAVCDPTPDCPGGGAGCTAGIGACLRNGVTSCPAGYSVASVCSAVAGSPASEVCGDAIDNDCDGTVDDGCSSCVPTGVEICDNLDNDCDGSIDEGCDDDGDDRCDSSMNMGPSGSLTCPLTSSGSGSGDDCDDTNSARRPGATEVCGNGLDEDCNGSDLACSSMCTPRTEVCGNGLDEDCNGSDLACSPSPTCGGSLVGGEICITYGADMPPLMTYGGTAVTDADIVIFDCTGTPRVIRIDAVTREACIPVTAACGGWLATTYSQTGTLFSDVNNIGSWYGTASESYLGMRGDDPRLSGTLTSVGQIRVFARSGATTRELTAGSWVAYDPSGVVVPTTARTHAGERVMRLMVPVRDGCAVSGTRPPDRY